MAETYHPVLGGGEKHTRSLAAGLARVGFTVDVITRRSSEDLAATEVDHGVSIHRVGTPGKGRGRKFGMIPPAWRAARELTPRSDVLMNGGTRVLALPARLAVAGTRCALVLRPELNGELDGSLALWGRDSRDLDRGLVYLLARFRNLLLRRTGAVVAISEAIAREAVASGFPKRKVHLIPHGIDMSEYAPVSAEEKASRRRELGLPGDKLLVVYTGRLIQGKGLETLFTAMKSGGHIGFEKVAWFNGGLFNDDLVFALDKKEIGIVHRAAKHFWGDVDPSILGTLFERGLDPDKRSQLGAHYTDRDKIMMIIEPVVTEPLLREWARVRDGIAARMDTARAALEDVLTSASGFPELEEEEAEFEKLFSWYKKIQARDLFNSSLYLAIWLLFDPSIPGIEAINL